jgi:hypothetical protein
MILFCVMFSVFLMSFIFFSGVFWDFVLKDNRCLCVLKQLLMRQLKKGNISCAYESKTIITELLAKNTYQ